jgi:hydrogenase small subunit
MMKVSRRDFLKISAATGVAAGLFKADVLQKALEAIKAASAGDLKIIWLHGQNCTGCTISAIQWNGSIGGTYYANLFELLSALGADVEFLPTIMTQAGVYFSDDLVEFEAYDEGTYVDAMQHLINTLKDAGTGKVTLIIEGSIPYPKVGDMEAGFCEVGMKYKGGGKYEGMWEFCDVVAHIMKNYQDKLNAIVAYGSCASFGGVTAGNPNPTGAKGVMHFFDDLQANMVPGREDHPDYTGVSITKPQVNLPACPAHPDWLVLAYAYVLYSGNAGSSISLDRWNRPTEIKIDIDNDGTADIVANIFGRTNHSDCERRKAFDAEEFASNWYEAIDNPEKCLLKLGCRGVNAWVDCAARKWNRDDSTQQPNAGNWCVAAGAPCNACCDPIYPDNVFMTSFFMECTHSDNIRPIMGEMPSSLACYTCHNVTMPRTNKEWM